MKIETVLGLAVLGVGGYLLYRWWQSQQVTVPAGVAAGLANPALARSNAFTANHYPGVAMMPSVPTFNVNDPLGLSNLTS